MEYGNRRYKIAESEKVPVDLSSMRRCLAEGRKCCAGDTGEHRLWMGLKLWFPWDFHGNSLDLKGFLLDFIAFKWDLCDFKGILMGLHRILMGFCWMLL